MGPAGSAVLWDVLVETLCEVGDAINVGPIECIGEIRCVDVFVRTRRRIGFTFVVCWEDLWAKCTRQATNDWYVEEVENQIM